MKKAIFVISTMAFIFASCSTAKGATYGGTAKDPPTIEKAISKVEPTQCEVLIPVNTYLMAMAPDIKIAYKEFTLQTYAPVFFTIEKPPLRQRSTHYLCGDLPGSKSDNKIDVVMRC